MAQAGIGVFILLAAGITSASVFGVSGGEMGRYVASRVREAIPAEAGIQFLAKNSPSPSLAKRGDGGEFLKPRMSEPREKIEGVTKKQYPNISISKYLAYVQTYFSGLADEWTALLNSRWTGEYVVVEKAAPSPGLSTGSRPSSPARGEEDKEVTVIREIVLRDIQVIERAVPGPVGPVGRPGKDGKDGRDGQNGLNGTNGNNGLSTPAEAGVHSPNEDLDSRLRGNDNSGKSGQDA